MMKGNQNVKNGEENKTGQSGGRVVMLESGNVEYEVNSILHEENHKQGMQVQESRNKKSWLFYSETECLAKEQPPL